MRFDRHLVIKSRNRMIYWWVATPFIMLAGFFVMGFDGELELQGAIWSLLTAIPYIIYCSLFFWRVWATPSSHRTESDVRSISRILAICILVFIGVQFIPITVVPDFTVNDTWIPLWVTGTIRGWGFPYFVARELIASFDLKELYGSLWRGSMVIDFSAVKGNLLTGLFLLYLLHWRLCSRWHKPTQLTEDGQQKSAPNP